MEALSIVAIFLAIFAIIVLAKTALVVPQQAAYVIERLGKYSNTLGAGFHILVPFVDRIAYKHSLKEHAYDTQRQVCITRDNVQVEIDGVLYLQVMNAERASYGIDNYSFAIAQLAQTTLRSEVGKLELDRTFEERAMINTAIVEEIDKAAEPWGVKVLRYEIKDIAPPHDVLQAMEETSEEARGEKKAELGRSCRKERVIKESEAKKMQQINEAEGQAHAILSIAKATAEGLREVATSLNEDGGDRAMELRIAEQYLEQFGEIAHQGNTIVLPANLSDVGSMITMAKGLLTTPKQS
ncbi:UNVERIFIED_CONTAM: hypothetical protein GTU68_045608 [Idotea baltica]|nr:hypothetical protein [Idotea baltica]